MIVTSRHLVPVLLSLLLAVSGPVSAVTKVVDGHATNAKVNCASLLVDQAENNSAPSDKSSHCDAASDMACHGAAGPGKCSFGFVLVLTASTDLLETGSLPVLSARVANYQDPFLAFITPPPQSHS
ncbi:hypothetical protein [Marinospirillum perlucidum]|uniref:hypothetical protein n=1 Tax=Marinospirillum perlucidum TaxID=1982602 RepID=UPI000DF1D4A1|nr:hypothetical protein [Marinospirillum perlucidum]